MWNKLLDLKKRGLPLSLMFVLSCAAAGPVPQQLAADQDRAGWPKEFEARDSRIVVYEPQLETFRGTRMTSRAAVSVTRPDAADPVFGGIWMDTTLALDSEAKVATPYIVRVTDVRFPNLSADEAARLRQDIADQIPRWNLSYSVDELHAQLRLIEERKAAAQDLKADVPKILFRIEPSVLLEIQGEPAWRKSANPAYERLENSATFVARNADTAYLRIAPFWWTSTNPLGAWQPTNDVPEAVAELWKNEPQPKQPSEEAPRRPEVIAVTEPTELVWTDGAPQYAPIAGTNLLYVRNTDSDVFLDIQTQFTYALFSGRWYRRPPTKDAWEFVASDRLPNDFTRIPVSSEKHHVLACVAGTPQAREAVKNTEIPQTEAVKPGPAPEMQAAYDGEPQFTQVPEAGVQYAVNTPSSIFCVDNRYYWCSDGIWYDSAYAVGPWYVCTFVPPPIYLIPPSCPHYYVTFCHVFGWSSGSVYVGYYPGYLGCYSWGGSVVFGTGWNYRPWIGTHCYTRPVTWGACARYNPHSCDWSIHGGGSVSNYRRGGGHSSGVHAGVGGTWGGGSGHYRGPSPQPPPSDSHSGSNLYRRQPERRLPRLQPPSEGGDPKTYREPERRDHPKTQPPPREEQPRNVPKTQPPPKEEQPRPLPKTQPPPTEKHETPRMPQPQPPPKEERHTPPPVEKREAPPRELPKRQPPPVEREERRTPPPPVEKRESPPPPRRMPPPAEREAPKSPPPPPPPPREHREAPKSPPPPRENREAQRNPPPRRDTQKSPPGQQQDRRR